MLKKIALLLSILLFNSTGYSLPPKQFSVWIEREMQQNNVPGVSIAVIKNYKIEWAMGFGVADKNTGRPVTTVTLFQAGSISKPVTAFAVFESVQADKLRLDENINEILTTWKVTDNQFTKKEKVTLRRLLSHSAGINVHGFGGYAYGDPLPTLLDVLNGTGASNSEAIKVIHKPGQQFDYSGGGFTILQQTLLDVYHQPFTDIMNTLVLSPLHMTQSTFQQLLPNSLINNIAIPYRPNGQPVTGGPHTYVELSAAGLWTTPSDLAKFIISIQQSLNGDLEKLLTKKSAELMVTPVKDSMGLGLFISDKFAEYKHQGHYFTHGGQNEGYINLLIGSLKDGNGAVIMTNMSPDSNQSKTMQTKNNVAFNKLVIKKIAEMENWQ